VGGALCKFVAFHNAGANPYTDPQIALMGVMNNQGEDSYLTTYTSPDGKLNSGYYVKKGDAIISSGEVINYLDQDKKVYVVADIEYLPGRQPDWYEADLQALFISGCDWANIGGAMNLKLPQGEKKHTFKSKDMMFAEDGYLVNLSKYSKRYDNC
jgi:hypothetical protein